MIGRYWGKCLVIVTLTFASAGTAHARHNQAEKAYQQAWCDKYNGQTEITLTDGTRADCLTDNFAIEFDFANKWAECLGQALHYADLTGKRPACVLIIEHGKDWKHYKKLRRTAKKRGAKAWYIRSNLE